MYTTISNGVQTRQWSARFVDEIKSFCVAPPNFWAVYLHDGPGLTLYPVTMLALVRYTTKTFERRVDAPTTQPGTVVSEDTLETIVPLDCHDGMLDPAIEISNYCGMLISAEPTPMQAENADGYLSDPSDRDAFTEALNHPLNIVR